MTFPVAGAAATEDAIADAAAPAWPEWQRWNDYGIGLLRKGGKSKGELRQAEVAFQRVEALGRPDGPLNLARVYLAQGSVEDPRWRRSSARRASTRQPPAWSLAWLSGLVNKQNGKLDEAIAKFKSVVDGVEPRAARARLRLQQGLQPAQRARATLHERAKQERGEARQARREELLRESASWFERTLAIDPENVTAHYNLYLIRKQLGDEAERDASTSSSTRSTSPTTTRATAPSRSRAPPIPAANHAAEAIVIYDLQRPGAFELPADAYLTRQEAPSG